MIHGVFIINNHGKARLIKTYARTSQETQQALVREIYSLLVKRTDGVCNFLEGGGLTSWGKDVKLVYRHFATLYFVFAADQQESELGILDLLQVFVETLDKCFEDVCELDIIFHSDRVHYILDEIVLGGMVLETNISEILESVNAMNQLEKSTRKAATKS